MVGTDEAQVRLPQMARLLLALPGVLRGVDMARGLYFLVTPAAPSILRQVNCLLLGGIMLPHTLLRVQVRMRSTKLLPKRAFELMK